MNFRRAAPALTLLLFCLPGLFGNLAAQTPGPDSSRTARPQMAEGGQPAQAGRFKATGRVTDGTNGAPIQFATVSVLRVADSSLVTGALADDQGNFLVDAIPGGVYLLRVGFIGYANVFNQIAVSPEVPVASLGGIILTQKSRRMNEVVVEADRPVMQLGIDRKTFDVSRSNLNPGGSASDVLGNIPTVTVDQDGNVSLRNNENVTIYIDGRPSGITAQNRAAILQQIPASSIDRIELITSPSARYDAEGVSGIINIILKKNKMEGFNGSLQAGIANRGKQNAAATLAYRNRWANAYANYSFRNSNRWVSGWLDRDTWNPSQTDSAVHVFTRTENDATQNDHDLNHAFKIGSDFTLPGDQTVGFSAGLTTNDELETENTRYNIYEVLYEPGTSPVVGRPTSYANRSSHAVENDINQDYTLSYRKRFDKKGHELAIDGSYAHYRNDNYDVFRQQGLLPGQSETQFTNFPFQEVSNDIVTRSAIGQLDYIRPMASGYKLETGLKSTNRAISSIFRYYASPSSETSLPEVLPQRNDFTFRENTMAAYLMGSRQWDKWGAQLGLRAERTDIGGTSEFLDTADREASAGIGQRPYWFLAPSLNLSYKLNTANEFQFGFISRINRPGREQLNPFTDYTDPTSRRTGNPSVGPEKIYGVEGTWQYSPGQHTVTSTVFLRNSYDVITRIIRAERGLSEVTFENAGRRSDYGVEIVSRIVPFKGFSITGSGSFFGSEIVLDSPYDTLVPVRRNVNYNFRIMANWQWKTGTNFQLTSGYRSPFLLPQGVGKPMYNTDVAVSQDLLKGKLQAAVAVNDIFNTMRFGVQTEGSNFRAAMIRKRETRFVTFTLTYRFGSMDNLSRRRENRREGGEGGEMMF